MYVPVAGGTETYRVVDLSPVESLLVPLILMARLGDKVVPGQPLYRPAAQPAGSALRAAVSLAHSHYSTIVASAEPPSLALIGREIQPPYPYRYGY